MDSASKGSRFISLIELLDRPLCITIGQIATAIENRGVYGWDRFGRFAKSDKKNAIKENALDALAKLWREQQAWEEDPKNWDPEEGWIDEFPLNDLHIEGSHPLQFFGWPNAQLPPFHAAEGAQSPAPPSLLGFSPRALYNITGALLRVALSKRERPMTEAQLINHLVETYKPAHGISKSNLEKQFSKAKRSLDGEDAIKEP